MEIRAVRGLGPPRKPRPPPEATRAPRNALDRWIDAALVPWRVTFVLAIATYVGIGFYLDGLGVHTAESLFLIEKAWLARFGPDPKLATIGLTHPSLPFFTSLASSLVVPVRNAPRIASAVFAATLLVMVLTYWRRLQGDRLTPLSAVAVASLAANPLLLFAAVSGNALIIYMVALGLFVAAFQNMEHAANLDIVLLIYGALSLGLAFFANYEALPMFLLILPGLYVSIRKQPDGEARANRRAQVLVFSLPILYAAGVWMFLNWLIMGTPIHFLNSPYSTPRILSQQVQRDPLLRELTWNPGGAAAVVLRSVVLLAPAYLLLPLLVRGTVRWLVVAPLLLFVGEVTAGLTRLEAEKFVVFPVMAALTMVGLNRSALYRPWMRTAFLALLVVSNIVPWFTLDAVGHEIGEIKAQISRLGNGTADTKWDEDRTVGRRIGEIVKRENARILVDDTLAYAIVVFSGQPQGFYTATHKDFDDFLKHPEGRIDYWLVPSPHREGGSGDGINRQYPQLFFQGAPNLVLQEDFGGWRLFRVKHTRPANVVDTPAHRAESHWRTRAHPG
jgi:hypothetical protein